MHVLQRLVRFSFFTLLDYLRSGRILVELLITLGCFYLFLWPRNEETLTVENFFSVAGLFSVALTLISMNTLLGLANRPQAYLLLRRRIGRIGYLLGSYSVAVLVVAGCYMLLSLLAALFSQIEGFGLVAWVLGSLPLMMNVALFGALVMLLSSLVLNAGWRLLILAMIAIALSDTMITGPLKSELPGPLLTGLAALQTLFSWPLVPPFFAYELAITRNYAGNAVLIIVAQFLLIIALLGLALYSFGRRDLQFSNS
jgi:hypothetical protein